MSHRYPISRTLSLTAPSIDCPVCCEALDFHQPSPASPEKLLATCEFCGSWFVVVDWVMARLPDENELLDVAMHPDGSGLNRPCQN